MKEYLLLKWGTIKQWDLFQEKSIQIFKQYADLGYSFSCAAQKDTPEQKKILCELIDVLDGKIQSDWTGEWMTKQEAKDYINIKK